MNEILSKLVESEILTEETKETIKSQLAELVAEARKNAEEDVRVELTKKFVEQTDALVEAVDAKLTEGLTKEIAELKTDIERFRDLEAEYAQRLVEAKAAMAKELEGDVAELLEKLDSFLEVRLNIEMQELREDIEEVRKLDFGRRMFEAFANEYKNHFIDEDEMGRELKSTKDQYKVMETSLEETEKRYAKLERQVKMTEVLAPLSGSHREVMETLLANVPTDQLSEAYTAFIGRILKENAVKTSEKEDKVLAEGAEAKLAEAVKEGVAVTGDTEKLQEDAPTAPALPSNVRAKWQKLAGIGKK